MNFEIVTGFGSCVKTEINKSSDSCNISSMRRSVSSPDETLRREKKYDAQRRIFDELRGV